MGKAVFVTEEAIDLCYDLMVLHDVYCQELPDDPLCRDYCPLKALKRCIMTFSKQSALAEMESLCRRGRNSKEVRELCDSILKEWKANT